MDTSYHRFTDDQQQHTHNHGHNHNHHHNHSSPSPSASAMSAEPLIAHRQAQYASLNHDDDGSTSAVVSSVTGGGGGHGHSHGGGHGHSHGGSGHGHSHAHSPSPSPSPSPPSSGHGHSHGGGSGGHGHSHGNGHSRSETDLRARASLTSPSSNGGGAASAKRARAQRACDGLGPRVNGAKLAVSPTSGPSSQSSLTGSASTVTSAAFASKHGHGHGKSDAAAEPASEVDEDNRRAIRQLWIASGLCFCFMVAEVIGGLMANSLAVLTDAAHLLSDFASFLISIFALWLARRAPTSNLSFGWHRAEILGALASVFLIWVLTGILIYEAVGRIREPEDVDGKLMFIVASAGLGVNIVMGVVLHQGGHGHSHGLGGGHGHSHGGGDAHDDHDEDDHEDDHEHGHAHAHGGSDHDYDHAHLESSHGHDEGGDHGHSHGGGRSGHGGHGGHGGAAKKKKQHRKHKNINVDAAFVHVLGDGLQSIGVMIAAGLIWYDDSWRIADPVCTFVFSLLVMFTTARLVKQGVRVLMEGTPEGLDPLAIDSALHAIPGVLEVHDLHVWSLSVGKPSLSAHLLVSDSVEARDVLVRANVALADEFNIHHTTIQIESSQDRLACNPLFNGSYQHSH